VTVSFQSQLDYCQPVESIPQATTLAVAQFFIELRNTPKSHTDIEYANDEILSCSHLDLYPTSISSYSGVQEPLLHHESPYALTSVITRPRSRSKPDDIFIHPTHSNLARADAVALEMGLSGDTDRVHGNIYPHEEAAWESGKGKDMARALLGSSRQDSQRHTFHIGGDDEEQDSDSSEL